MHFINDKNKMLKSILYKSIYKPFTKKKKTKKREETNITQNASVLNNNIKQTTHHIKEKNSKIDKKNHSIFFRILPDRVVYRRKIKSMNDFSPDGLHNFVLSAESPIPSRSVAVLCPVRLMSSIAIEQNGNAELIAETRLGLGREIRGNFALLSESRRFNQRHLSPSLPRSKRLSKIADEAREKERFVHVIYPGKLACTEPLPTPSSTTRAPSAPRRGYRPFQFRS